MKTSILYPIIIALALTSCYEEDPITAERGEARYDLTDDPADPVQHFIHEFYRQYSTVIITNPREEDYKFNFASKNRYAIVPPRQDKALLASGLEFMQTVFTNLYTDTFKKEYFPYSILLADSIFDAGYGSDAYNHSVSTSYFVAIGNIRPGIESLTPAELNIMRAEINAKFWTGYMIRAKGFFKPDEAFYAVSNSDYSKVVIDFDDGKTPEDIDFHEMGLITYDEEMSMIDPDDPDWNFVMTPYAELDLEQWLNFIFAKTPDEIKAITDKYPKMKQKYDLLRVGMLECGGFDIGKMGE